MTKQCLFDPNHMINEYAYEKHLKDCQSTLKKDWKQCRFNQQHWLLYKHIQFHQKFQCQQNPQYRKNPKAFLQKREQQIRRLRYENKKNKNKDRNKNQSFLSFLQQESKQKKHSKLHQSFQNSKKQIVFGDISFIENINNQKVNQNQNTQLLDKKEFQELMNSVINKRNQNGKTKQKLINQSSLYLNQDMTSFLNQPNISKTKKQKNNFWKEPDFCEFQKQFKKQWLLRIQKQ